MPSLFVALLIGGASILMATLAINSAALSLFLVAMKSPLQSAGLFQGSLQPLLLRLFSWRAEELAIESIHDLPVLLQSTAFRTSFFEQYPVLVRLGKIDQQQLLSLDEYLDDRYVYNGQERNVQIFPSSPSSSPSQAASSKLYESDQTIADNTALTRFDLQQALDANATINSIGLQEWKPALAAFSYRLGASTGLQININSYLARTGLQSGVSLHSDRECVVIVQLTGFKTWRLYRVKGKVLGRDKGGDNELPVRRYQQRGKNHEDMIGRYGVRELDLLIEVTLEPGMLLYVPRGVLHATSTVPLPDTPAFVAQEKGEAWTAQPSFHLTIDLKALWSPHSSHVRRSMHAQAGGGKGSEKEGGGGGGGREGGGGGGEKKDDNVPQYLPQYFTWETVAGGGDASLPTAQRLWAGWWRQAVEQAVHRRGHARDNKQLRESLPVEFVSLSSAASSSSSLSVESRERAKRMLYEVVDELIDGTDYLQSLRAHYSLQLYDYQQYLRSVSDGDPSVDQSEKKMDKKMEKIGMGDEEVRSWRQQAAKLEAEALAQEERGDMHGAVLSWKRAHLLFPHDPYPMNRIAVLLQAVLNYSEASVWLERAMLSTDCSLATSDCGGQRETLRSLYEGLANYDNVR